MTIDKLIIELHANNIKETACLILPNVPVEGALCLIKADDSHWRVILNERGEYLTDKTFQSEHDACRFFLKKALFDPTYRKDFTPAALQAWASKRAAIAAKYGFNESSDVGV
jgi:hypothetical protein